jgi:hypothetical protein
VIFSAERGRVTRFKGSHIATAQDCDADSISHVWDPGTNRVRGRLLGNNRNFNTCHFAGTVGTIPGGNRIFTDFSKFDASSCCPFHSTRSSTTGRLSPQTT